MNYQFFLFSKLFDLHHKSQMEYDLLFEELSDKYKDWLIWDVDNGKNIGTYESMSNYFKNHKFQNNDKCN